MEKEKQMPAAAENTTEIDPALCRPVGSKLDTDQIVRPSVSYWAGVWRRLRQDKLAIACALLLLVLILFLLLLFTLFLFLLLTSFLLQLFLFLLLDLV